LYIPWGNWLWGMGVGGSGAGASPFAPCGVWLANGKSEITGPTIVVAGLIRDLGWLAYFKRFASRVGATILGRPPRHSPHAALPKN